MPLSNEKTNERKSKVSKKKEHPRTSDGWAGEINIERVGKPFGGK